MEELENKYIALLLDKCLNFKKSKSLLVSYDFGSEKFVEKLCDEAKKRGIVDICTYYENSLIKHKILDRIKLEDIESHHLFNKKIWDEYALKKASILELTTYIPGLMDDIDPVKVAKANFVDRTSRPIEKKLQLNFEIPWCIAAFPNYLWAKKLFPTLNDDDAYNKLFELICDMCMLNNDNPLECWDLFLKRQKEYTKKLNELQIKQLYYKNSLGTNLKIALPENVIWQDAGNLGDDMIVNMPSYEIFTSPNYHETEGIVYNSRPLVYGGGVIDDFYIEFKNGKVINYDAKIGLDILKGIIESDNQSCYLGEVALINYNSPISNTGLVFEETLFDENASCHLALGNGFKECIKNGNTLSDTELMNKGINVSKNHVDFMIGTGDLEIEAETNQGKKLIFKKGNFNL